jgi:EthD domain
MWTLIANFRRKPELTFEQFKDYYEKHHVPLAQAQCEKFVVAYRRNYVKQNLGYFAAEGAAGAPASQGYDCVTELWFKSRAELDSLLAHMSKPEVQKLITQDEENFVDRGSIHLMFCEVEVSI